MNSTSYREDEEIMETFIQEMERRLSEMNSGLSALEPGRAPDRETMDAIFRAAHSLKSSANLLAFKNIEAVTHQLESVLDAMRWGKLVPRAETLEALNQGLDTLQYLLEDLETEDEADVGTVLAVMEQASHA